MVDVDPFDLVSERRYGQARRAIESALLALDVDLPALEAYMIRRQPQASVAALDSRRAAQIVETEWLPVAAAQYRAAFNETARSPQIVHKDVLEEGALTFSFQMTVPQAIRWAEREAGRLIVEIDEATRQAIRQLVVRALAEGGNPIAVARTIRGLIGLHSQWAVAVLNRSMALEAAGFPADVVGRMTQSYYRSLLKTRSETIARTEILRASNEGRMESYREARRRGLFGGREPMKQWSAANDAEENCADLDGMVIPFDDTFPGGVFGDTDSPPLHPNCRCTTFLVLGHRVLQEV